MNKTKIEWCDYTWNPVVGCKNTCEYCYAKKIYKRFHKDSFEDIKYYPGRLNNIKRLKKPSRIFVNSMSDINYWQCDWLKEVVNTIKLYPQHTFLFLTKFGHIYKNLTFPKNCWLGQTITSDKEFRVIDNDNIRFVSLEPLLIDMTIPAYYCTYDIEWLIIGGLSPKPVHKTEWVDKIIGYCRKRKIPIFIKDNAKYPIEIKEFPKIFKRGGKDEKRTCRTSKKWLWRKMFSM